MILPSLDGEYLDELKGTSKHQDDANKSGNRGRRN